jgi:hypothetical protein
MLYFTIIKHFYGSYCKLTIVKDNITTELLVYRLPCVFSAAFFTGTDVNGAAVMGTSPRLWLFFGITIPLTIVVFVLWILWQRQQDTSEAIGVGQSFNINPEMIYKGGSIV